VESAPAAPSAREASDPGGFEPPLLLLEQPPAAAAHPIASAVIALPNVAHTTRFPPAMPVPSYLDDGWPSLQSAASDGRMKIRRWQQSTPPDEGSLRSALEAEGYSVYAWTDPCGATYPPHTHDDDHSHWILRGSLALTVEGEEYVLRAGDRDWLAAGTRHSARVVGDEAVTYLIGSKSGTRNGS
jgi:quercetin dioxygenase-like cupin family protein